MSSIVLNLKSSKVYKPCPRDCAKNYLNNDGTTSMRLIPILRSYENNLGLCHGKAPGIWQYEIEEVMYSLVPILQRYEHCLTSLSTYDEGILKD